MSANIEINFNFGDGTTHDASVSEISEPQLICHDYTWLLVPKSSGLDASPTYSFEVSDDNINWQEFQPETKDAAIDQPFQKSDLAGLYFRINYNAQTNTTGTVAFTLTGKKN